jgi:hypothetical protein
MLAPNSYRVAPTRCTIAGSPLAGATKAAHCLTPGGPDKWIRIGRVDPVVRAIGGLKKFSMLATFQALAVLLTSVLPGALFTFEYEREYTRAVSRGLQRAPHRHDQFKQLHCAVSPRQIYRTRQSASGDGLAPASAGRRGVSEVLLTTRWA